MRIDIHVLGAVLVVCAVAICAAIATKASARREREEMRRHVGQWKDRDAYDRHVKGESDE